MLICTFLSLACASVASASRPENIRLASIFHALLLIVFARNACERSKSVLATNLPGRWQFNMTKKRATHDGTSHKSSPETIIMSHDENNYRLVEIALGKMLTHANWIFHLHAEIFAVVCSVRRYYFAKVRSGNDRGNYEQENIFLCQKENNFFIAASSLVSSSSTIFNFVQKISIYSLFSYTNMTFVAITTSIFMFSLVFVLCFMRKININAWQRLLMLNFIWC